MKSFFNVMDAAEVLAFRKNFPKKSAGTVRLENSLGRVLAADMVSSENIPDFSRAAMDGYAVRAASSYGASESSPAFLTIAGSVVMGRTPDFSVKPGEAARISTGGMLPEGADAVVMIEHTERIDGAAIEVYKSAAPGQHVILRGEDVAAGSVILRQGDEIRPQEMGLLAALGRDTVPVYDKPVVSVISTGDEVVPVRETPSDGRVRDINTYTLLGLLESSGAVPLSLGIVRDVYEDLLAVCRRAAEESDMVLISGGSSVGKRDYTLEVLKSLPDARIMAHGISISPGKPTIVARASGKPVFGLPGHAVSAMIIYQVIVKPFLDHIRGASERRGKPPVRARLTRNLASAQGRVDYVRVRLREKQDGWWAEPIPGKSGLIRTMVTADGLIVIERDVEGLVEGEPVSVIPV